MQIEGLDIECFVYALLYKFIDAHIVYQLNRRISQDHNYIIFPINKVTEQTSWNTNPCHTKNMWYVSFVTDKMESYRSLYRPHASCKCWNICCEPYMLLSVYADVKSHMQYAWTFNPLHTSVS